MANGCCPGTPCYQAQQAVSTWVAEANAGAYNEYFDCVTSPWLPFYDFPCSAITDCILSGDTNIANADLEFDGHHSAALNNFHWDIRNTMVDNTTILFKIAASTGIQFGNGDGVGSTGYEFPLIRGSAGQVLQLVNTATTVTTTPGELVWGDGNPTPITFITNSSWFINVAGATFIGNSRAGFAGADEGLAGGWVVKVVTHPVTGSSILNENINVAIPVPLNIYSGTTSALNVCGHAYTNRINPSIESFTAITYYFTCNTTDTTIPILELGRTEENFGVNGVGCFNMKIDAPPHGLSKCVDFIIVGFKSSVRPGSWVKFSYRGSVENIQPN